MSGNIAILGGLMEDKIDYQTKRVPLLGQIPLAGELVNNRNNAAQKTELVICLRPVVIKDASLDGDYAGMRGFLHGVVENAIQSVLDDQARHQRGDQPEHDNPQRESVDQLPLQACRRLHATPNR